MGRKEAQTYEALSRAQNLGWREKRKEGGVKGGDTPQRMIASFFHTGSNCINMEECKFKLMPVPGNHKWIYTVHSFLHLEHTLKHWWMGGGGFAF